MFNCVSKMSPLPRSYVGLPAAPAATPCLTILFHEGISSLYRCLWRLTSFISLQLKQLTLVFSLGLGLGVSNGLGSLLKLLEPSSEMSLIAKSPKHISNLHVYVSGTLFL